MFFSLCAERFVDKDEIDPMLLFISQIYRRGYRETRKHAVRKYSTTIVLIIHAFGCTFFSLS